MVQVLVCKNDGCFEFEAAELALRADDGWEDVKMALAHALYCEEELFAVGSPDDIALYKLPDGDPVEHEDVEQHVISGSRWVLDIFSSPLRRTSDLNMQTDQAIRGMRRGQVHPRRISALSSFMSASPASSPISPLGNARASVVIDPLTQSIGGAVTTETAYQEPYIHIGTWVPMMVKEKGRFQATVPATATSAPVPTSPPRSPAGVALLSLLKPPTSPAYAPTSGSEYEDVMVTTRRAMEYINKFRTMGRPVTVMSIQTCSLPVSAASPSAISKYGPRGLYQGVFEAGTAELERGFVQAVRLWFSFDCEQTVSVTKVRGTLGLKPLRQQDGWIVVQALPGSPCFEAGMRRDEVFLTHVNGVDVSPHAFPAVGVTSSGSRDDLKQQQQQQQPYQAPSWKDSVVPLVEQSETCIFTFF